MDRHQLAYTAAALSMSRVLLAWNAATALLSIVALVAGPAMLPVAGALCAALGASAIAAVHGARAAFDAAIFRWWASQDAPGTAIESFDRWLAERGRRPAPRSIAERADGALKLLRRALAWSVAGTLALLGAAAWNVLQRAA